MVVLAMLAFTLISFLLAQRAAADGVQIPLVQQTPSPLGLDPFNAAFYQHYVSQFEVRVENLFGSLVSGLEGEIGLENIDADGGHAFGTLERRRKRRGRQAKRRKPKHRATPPSRPLKNPRAPAVNLTNNFSTMWTGTVEIGNPPSSFRADFDTGSADLFVPSVDCTSSACAVKHKYDPANSTTSSATGRNFSIRYADGSNTTGRVFTDVVSLAGVSVKNQTFAATTSLSDSFASDPLDGIVGLGFEALSNLKAPPFVQNAFAQGVIAAQKFSFYLAKEGSELTLGGSNDALYQGQPEGHKVASKTIWQLGNGKVYVNDNSLVSIPLVTSIDTGTSLIFGPAAHVAALWKQVPGSSLWNENSSLWTFPCNTTATVSFQWDDGKKWQLSASTLSQGRTGNEGLCVGSISGHDLGMGNVWLLGDAFLRNVYSIFDLENGGSIAFASLRDPSQ